MIFHVDSVSNQEQQLMPAQVVRLEDEDGSTEETSYLHRALSRFGDMDDPMLLLALR